jgi:hypothetical protein
MLVAFRDDFLQHNSIMGFRISFQGRHSISPSQIKIDRALWMWDRIAFTKRQALSDRAPAALLF